MRLRANISAKLVQKWPLYEYKNVVLHEINREKSEVANNHIHLLYPRIDEIDTSNYLRTNLFEFTIRRFYYISIFPGNLYNFISNFDSKGIWLSLFVWEPFYSDFQLFPFYFKISSMYYLWAIGTFIYTLAVHYLIWHCFPWLFKQNILCCTSLNRIRIWNWVGK